MSHDEQDKKKRYNWVLLGAVAVLILLGAVSGADTGIWTDETLADTITQTNTDYQVCMGDTCYTSWQVSISNNASVNNSQICTPANQLCNEAINDTDHIGGNAQIVSSAGAGAFTVRGSGGASAGGSIDFGANTAALGISQDGTYNGYDYDGTFVFKQKAANPAGAVEFLFIEESGDWRLALPTSATDQGTYNPRSMIIAGPSTNDADSVSCSYWGFDELDCDTSGTGADLGVQDDLQVLGQVNIGANITIGRNPHINTTTTGTGDSLLLIRPTVTTSTAYTFGDEGLDAYSRLLVLCKDANVDATDRDCFKITAASDIWQELSGGIFQSASGPMGNGGSWTLKQLFHNYISANLGTVPTYQQSSMHVNSQRSGASGGSSVQAFSIKATEQATASTSGRFTAVSMYYTMSNIAGGARTHSGRTGATDFYIDTGGNAYANGPYTFDNHYAIFGGYNRRAGNNANYLVTEGGILKLYVLGNTQDNPMTEWNNIYHEDFSNFSNSQAAMRIEAATDTPGAQKQSIIFEGDEWDEGGLVLGTEQLYTENGSLNIKTGGNPSSGTDFDLSINNARVNITVDLEVAGETHLYGDVYHYANCYDDNATSCYADIAERMHTKETEQQTTCTAAWTETITYYEIQPITEASTSTECQETDTNDIENFNTECHNVTRQITIDHEYTEKTKEVPHPSTCTFTGTYDAPNGMPVCADPDNPRMIQQCENAYDTKVLGVISYNATQILGQAGYPIALAGNVPIRVECTGIEPGDLLCVDSTTSRAQECNIAAAPDWQTGLQYTAAVFAKALEPCTTGGTEVIRGWI